MRFITTVGLAVVLLGATIALGAAHAAGKDAAFDRVVARLRASFESTKQMPLDADLYAPNLHVSHNYEAGRTVDPAVFLAGVAKELAAAKDVGANNHAELTRFLVADDTVVTTVLMTGQLKDGSPTRFYIAYFFKIQDGRIADLETWYDRKGSEQQAQAISKEMGGPPQAPH